MFCSGLSHLGVTAVASSFLVVLSVPSARSHDAPTGWSYPFSCCSNFDCRHVDSAAISERPEGYVIENTGEVLRYTDARLKNSPDGRFHWCSVGGASDSRTICLFVPPRSY